MGRVALGCGMLLSIASAELFAQCAAPSAPAIISRPASSVGRGQTYGISWTPTSPDGAYEIERSTSPDFTAAESQRTGNPGASFISLEPAVWYHRVRGIAACDPRIVSAPSETVVVHVDDGSPVVIFTTAAVSVIAPIGSVISGMEKPVTVENVGNVPVIVRITTEMIDSPQFFHVVSATGADVGALRLEPHLPHRLTVRFGDVESGLAKGFQGLIAIEGVDRPLASKPYSWVALKIGSGGSAVPEFRIFGDRVDRLSLPPLAPGIPDDDRVPLRIEIFNPGNDPLHLVGEVGPEAWLEPRAGWNDSPVPPHSSITVDLLSRRARAIAEAAFPRYTFFTVKTDRGSSARLLIEDRQSSGATIVPLPPLPAGRRALMLPLVAAIRGSARTVFSTRVRIANVSDERLALELFFRSQGTTGLDATRIELLVEPRDVVSIADLLRDQFGVDNTSGFVEIRIDESKARFLAITGETYATSTFGEFTARLPVFENSEGTTAAIAHVVPAVWTPATRTNIGLLNTARGEIASAQVELTAYDSDGVALTTASIGIAPAQFAQLSLGGLLNASPTEESRIASLRVAYRDTRPTGSVAIFSTMIDNLTAEVVAVHVGQPQSRPENAKSPSAAGVSVSKAHMVLGAINAPADAGAITAYSTRLNLTAIEGAAEVVLSYLASRAIPAAQPKFTLPAGSSIELPDIATLFGLGSAGTVDGTLLVHAVGPIQVAGRVIASPFNGIPYVAGELPVLSDASEALTSAAQGSRRPIYFDGLEQSSEGKRWTLGLTEISGQTAAVNVRLYEPGNRAAPIAEQIITLRAREHMTLDTVFRAMGLDTDDRRKERINVQVVVTPVSGRGVVAALATGYDDRSGDSTRFVLTPSGGIPATGISRVSPVNVPVPDRRPRRRAVRP